MGGPFQEKTVWVLSGGGAQGAVQVGMMRALLAAGHAPDAIVATSVGSLNGSFFAVDPTLERLDELAEKWRSVSVTSMFGTKREVVTNVARRRPYLFGNDRLLQVITDWLPATRLEDLKVPNAGGHHPPADREGSTPRHRRGTTRARRSLCRTRPAPTGSAASSGDRHGGDARRWWPG